MINPVKNLIKDILTETKVTPTLKKNYLTI